MKPPRGRDLVEECSIGFGVDKVARKVIMQFDRHVRAVGLDEDAAVELVQSLCKALAELGVVVVREETAH